MNAPKQKTYKSLGLAVLTLISSLSLMGVAEAQGRGRPIGPNGPGPGPSANQPVTPPIQRYTPGDLGRNPIRPPAPAPPRTTPGTTPAIGQGRGSVIPNPPSRVVPDPRNNTSALDRYKRTQEANGIRNPNQKTWVLPPVYYYPYDWYSAMYNPYYRAYIGPLGSYGYYPLNYYPLGYYPYSYNPFGYYPPATLPSPYAPYPYGDPFADPYRYDNGAVNDRQADAAIRQAAKDIRQAWIDNNLDKFARYTRRDATIEVQSKGEKAKSQDVSAFLDSQRSEFNEKTIDFTFDDPERIKPGIYRLTGHHTVQDHGNEVTTTIKYTLELRGGHFYIIRVETE